MTDLLDVEHGTIEQQKIHNAIAALGFTDESVVSMHVDAHHAGLVVFKRNAEGHLYPASDDPEVRGFAKRRIVLTSEFGVGESCDVCGVL